MLDALVAGETDPELLAQLARRQMRKKIPAWREALAGHFDEHHRLWIGAILAWEAVGSGDARYFRQARS